MDKLAAVVIQQYFISKCVLIFNDKSTPFEEPLVNVAVRINIVSSSSFDQNLVFRYHGCQDILLKTKNPVSFFEKFETAIRVHKDRFNYRKYLVLSVSSENEKALDMFKSKAINYVSDIIIIEGKTSNSSLNLWTHPYNTKENYNLPYVIDKWFIGNNSFAFNNDLYPDKLTMQRGRIIRVAIFDYPPYVVIDNETTPDLKLVGSEISTMLHFCNQYNLTMEPVINELDYWGSVNEDWSGNGLMGNIASDAADIGMAALYTWEYQYKFFDYAKPTVRTGITCLVPAPKLAAGWLTPLWSYSNTMWIFVLIVYIVSVFTLFVIDAFDLKFLKSSKKLLVFYFDRAVMNVGKAFIMQPLTWNDIPVSGKGRFFAGLVFILSLFLTSSYNSGFASILTIPRYENPINTKEELADSGVPWGATDEAWIASIQTAKNPVLQKIVKNFNKLPEDQLRKNSKTKEFGFSLERLPRDDFAIGSYITADVIQDFHLMKEDIYWEQSVMMMRKNHVLFSLIDMFVLRTSEAGLILYWQNEAVRLYMDQQVQRAVRYYNRHSTNHEVVKLRIVHVQGAFGILLWGLLLSLILFTIEIFRGKLLTKTITV